MKVLSIRELRKKTGIMESKKTDLKICPFCGSEGKIVLCNYGNGSEYMPYCSNHECVAGEGGFYSPNRDEAIKKWNERQGDCV